ncbi:MAG: tetratricopeptide repeat protein [Phycisphaeraceae bacterium]
MPRPDPNRNRRRLIRLSILAAAVLVVGGVMFALFQLNAGKQDLETGQIVSQARAAYEQADYARVLELIEDPKRPGSTIDAIRDDPAMLKVYIEARRSSPLKNGEHLARLIAPLQQVVRLAPDDTEARLELFELLFVFERFGDARRLAEALVKQDPEDAVLWRLLGDAQLGLGADEKALEAYEQAASIDPLHVPTQHAIVKLYAGSERDTAPLIDRANKLLADHPDDPRAVLVSAIMALASGENRRGAEGVLAAAQLDPPDEDFVPVMLAWLDRLDLYSASAQFLDRVARGGIASPAGHESVLRTYDTGDLDGVLRRLEGADPNDAHPNLVAVWALASDARGNDDQTKRLIEHLYGRADPLSQAWADVLRLSLVKQAPPGEIINQLNDALERENELAGSQPVSNNAYLRQLLGESYLRVDEPDAALSQMRAAAENRPSWGRPHRLMARAHLDRGEPAEALRHAQLAWNRQPGVASETLLILARLGTVKPNEQAAVNAVLADADRFLKQVPDHAELFPATIDMLARVGRKDAAAQRITELLALDPPTSPMMLRTLVEQSRRLGLGVDQPIAQALAKLYSDTPEHLSDQALTLANQGKPEEGRRLIQDAMPDDADPGWRRAMGNYLARINAPDTAAYWIEFADANPDALDLQLSALQVRGVREDTDFAKRAIERLKRLGGERSAHWRLEQARLLLLGEADRAQQDRALSLLKQAERIAPQRLEIQLELARCHLLLGDLPAAERHAERAWELSPDRPGVALLLGQVLHQRGRFADARGKLTPITIDSTADPRLRLNACAVLVEQGDASEARRGLEAMRAAGVAPRPALLLLARLYAQDGRLDLADAVCVELLRDPDLEAIAYVSDYYAQTGRTERAEQTRARAAALGLAPADQLTLDAQSAAQRGDIEAALGLLTQAAEADPTNAVRWRSAARLALSASQTDRAITLAKRGLAHVKADTGLAGLIKHEKLIAVVGTDKHLIPLAIAILNRTTHRGAAIQSLRLIASDQEQVRVADGLATLADEYPAFEALYEIATDRLIEAGRNQRAFDLASGAMARFSNNANLARGASIAAYRLGRWGELLSASRAWSERNPADRPLADLMIAAAQDALGRYPAVVQTLAPHVAKLKGGPDANPQHYLLYTRALVLTGQTDRAWELLEPLLSSSAIARYAALQRISDDIQQSQTASAWLAAIIRAGSAEPGERFELARAAFVAGKRLGDPGLIQTARDTIDGILGTPGDHPPQAYNMQGLIAREQSDFEPAKAAFRKVLESDPDNPQVLNNLAMVLLELGDDLPEAERVAKRATALAGNDPNLFDTLAIVLLRRGKLDAADQAIERAIQLDPETPGWRLTRADILEAQGKVEQAQTIRKRYGVGD